MSWMAIMSGNMLSNIFDVKCGTDYSLKKISIGSSGGDLPFEGLRGRFFQASKSFCHNFISINPQRSDHRTFSGISSEISSFRNSPCRIWYLGYQYMIRDIKTAH
jgi:hypothetical protein